MYYSYNGTMEAISENGPLLERQWLVLLKVNMGSLTRPVPLHSQQSFVARERVISVLSRYTMMRINQTQCCVHPLHYADCLFLGSQDLLGEQVCFLQALL
jgi:hypothetical protein